MNPLVISAQAAIVACALAFLCVFGDASAARSFAVSVVGVSVVLAVINWRPGARRAWPRKGQLRPVLIPVSLATLIAIPWLVSSSISLHKDRTVLLAIVITLATTWSVLLLSSLVDWFYVLPRLRGEHGLMPCESSLAPRWRLLTRLWLSHRLVAILTFVLGNAVIVGVAAYYWFEGINQLVAGGMAATATILAGYYLTRAAPVMALILSPAIQVGDKVKLAEEFQTANPACSYFVVDISMEGVRLLELDADDRVPQDERDPNRTHDRVLDISEATKLLRSRRRFMPCKDVDCKGVNAYCPRRKAMTDSN